MKDNSDNSGACEPLLTSQAENIVTMGESHTMASYNVNNSLCQQNISFSNNQNNPENPFLKSRKMMRTPMRARCHSVSEGSMPIQQRDFPPTQNPNNMESAIIENLESQLKAAQNEIKELKEILATMRTSKTIGVPTTWKEEEEIVTQETAWMLPKNKKRKAVSSPEQIKTDSQTSSKKAPETPAKKIHKPPPVILSNIKDYNQININLQAKKIKFQTKLLNNNQLKINVDSETEYRDLTSFVNNNNIEWHTYENKQTRPIRVMARNLHPSCSPEMIKEELLDRNFQILEVANKIKKITEDNVVKRIQLPLFMLTFKNTENLKNIYEIKHICGMQIKIETIKNNTLIPQCKKCQRFGHTQKYCQRPAVCVKCAGSHLTIECNKPKNVKPKCSNCGEDHPASYRGCLVAKELQKRRNNIIQSKDTEVTHTKSFTPKKVSMGTSYAQATQNINNIQVAEKEKPKAEQKVEQKDERSIKLMIKDMMEMMGKFSERLDRMEARSTGTISRLVPNVPTRS